MKNQFIEPPSIIDKDEFADENVRKLPPNDAPNTPIRNDGYLDEMG